MREISSLNELLKKIHDYEFNLILIIIGMLKYSLIYKYFDTYDVQVRYCYIHDQGCLLSWPKKHPILVTIFTKTCNNYCELELVGKFTQNFIKDYYNQIITNKGLDFKLESFMTSYYDYQKDMLLDISPLPIKLFYEQYT